MKTYRNRLIPAILLLIATLFGTSANAQSQDNELQAVQPLSMTKLRPVLFDIYLFGAGSYNSNKNLWTANNNSYSKRVYGTFVNAGVEAEAYKGNMMRLGGALGYKYQRYAYDAGLSANDGVFSHWLTADLNLNYWYFCAGLLSDIYLNSYTKSKDHFSYEGLNSDCFNKASLAWYVGANMRFTRVKAEIRIGSFIKPQLNAEKIAHYNMHKSMVSSLFWEAKLSYRIFTSGKHYQSGGIFE